MIEDLEVNNNGERFHSFFNTFSLSVLNTWFTHKRSRRTTWHSPDGVTKKVYDFILSCSWLRKYVQNCRVYNSYDFDSDHRLVVADLCTPTTKVARHITRSSKQNKKKHLELRSLEKPEIKEAFVNAAVEKLLTTPIEENATNSEIHKQLVDTLNTAANETIPRIEKEKLTQPWHDDEILKDLYNTRDKLKKNSTDEKAIAAATKKVRKRVRFLRDEYYKAEAAKINQFAINRELEKLFARAKKQGSTLKRVPESCPADKIKEHFKAHFNPDQTAEPPEELCGRLPAFLEHLQSVSDQFTISNEPPSDAELKKGLEELKTKKSNNDVDPDLLKRCDHPVIFSVIRRLSTNLWEKMDIAEAWGKSRLKTL